ncbi:MAG: hypothetical protein KME54_16240 [Tolypothrix brevis GSE-NOS-MK-07-07A]|nr:hypothetical protein [Tolypothrix brevis GSE-NOS-MK-07-07A]
MVADMVSSLIEETITSLMSRLDDEQNWNLFYIINFLNLYYYYLPDTSPSQKHDISILYGELIQKIKLKDKEYKCDLTEQFKKIMSLYGELIQKIKCEGEDYKRKVEEQFQKSHQGLDSKDNNKIPNHTEIINKFKVLNSHEQQNLKYLGWFILYCKIYKLDINDPKRITPIWQRYSCLIEQIKCLPINERI